MTNEKLYQILKTGETVAVEFKRCGGHIENDVYETVCSFSNRFGGDIFLGVTDEGLVEGVPENAAPEMIKNFVSVISNPTLFFPTLYLEPEVMKYKGKTIIHIKVPTGGDVYTFKKIIYDRANDADVKVTATTQIAQIYIRKQEIYTERKVFPYLKKEDLRLDLLPRLRILAVNNAGGSHPWQDMSNDALFKSARLYMKDPVTGKSGFNLAAAMLLGKDETVQNVCPAYVTDAILRKVNLDRYDDRDFIQTNLIESYSRLFEFAKKHLPDKFYVEDLERKSLRNIIVREMIGNTLMHREFSSAYQAKFVIENDRMYVENANRTKKDGLITPKNLEPYPKNPIIASFFRTIGFADQLGSGVRKMFKYTKLYSGDNPVFLEGDIFKIIVPLNESYSFDSLEPEKRQLEPTNEPQNEPLNEPLKSVLEVICRNPYLSKEQIAAEIGKSRATVTRSLSKLQNDGVIQRIGADKNGCWKIEELGQTETITEPLNAPQSEPQNEPLNEPLKSVLEVIRRNPYLSKEQIAAEIGKSRATVTRALSKLQNEKIIQRIGADKNGYWKIIINKVH